MTFYCRSSSNFTSYLEWMIPQLNHHYHDYERMSIVDLSASLVFFGNRTQQSTKLEHWKDDGYSCIRTLIRPKIHHNLTTWTKLSGLGECPPSVDLYLTVIRWIERKLKSFESRNFLGLEFLTECGLDYLFRRILGLIAFHEWIQILHTKWGV